MKSTKTFSEESIQRKWFVVDAEGQVLGRLASQVAHIVRGKHRPVFSPHLDMGDHVVVVNAAKIKATGNKAEGKIYTRYTGYPGGLRKQTLGRAMEVRPEFAVGNAIRGMLPRNKLGKRMFRKVRVYSGADHPHQAQSPEPLSFS